MTKHNAGKQKAEVADTNLEPRDIPLEESLPAANDPGGAHAKGYSADPGTDANVKDKGPIPLADVPDEQSRVRQPEREGKAHPTGRGDPADYTSNDRPMGSDR